MEQKKRAVTLKSSLFMLILIYSFTLQNAAAESYCRAQRRTLVNACKRLMFRQSPTPECCDRLRVTPTSCVCPVITPQVAALIDVNFAVSVIRRCGRPVPRGFRCGSLTAP